MVYIPWETVIEQGGRVVDALQEKYLEPEPPAPAELWTPPAPPSRLLWYAAIAFLLLRR